MKHEFPAFGKIGLPFQIFRCSRKFSAKKKLRAIYFPTVFSGNSLELVNNHLLRMHNLYLNIPSFTHLSYRWGSRRSLGNGHWRKFGRSSCNSKNHKGDVIRDDSPRLFFGATQRELQCCNIVLREKSSVRVVPSKVTLIQELNQKFSQCWCWLFGAN